MISNSSIGANPVCPKSVDRAVVNHMGESERIAEKFVGNEYAGRAIEPRTERSELTNTLKISIKK